MTDTTTAAADSGTGWQPAFDGQREPFREGNTLAQVSGYRSPRAVQALAARLLAELLVEQPELDRPRYRFDAEAWAFAEARAQLHREHESTVGLFDQASGATRSALHDRVRAAERDAAQARDRLGLGPLAEARLRRDQSAAVAFAGPELLAARMAAGRAAIEAREAADRSAADEHHDDGHDDKTEDRA